MGYIKNYEDWNASQYLLSGKAMNHLESQYDYSKSDADVHNHDSIYYTKTLADNTFFTLINSLSLEADADKLDGLHYSDILSTSLPIGSIIIWSGTDANIPNHWHICDGGTYGGIVSPDLRDRFVPCAGNVFAKGANGGPGAWNGNITPTASVTVDGHQLTLNELPEHDHTYTDYYGVLVYRSMVSNANYPNTAYQDIPDVTNYIGGGGSHGHPGSTITFNAIDPRPKYYALFYIIRYE